MKNRAAWILTLLLIVLPIISYFFLNEGSRFFYANYSELTPKGELPELIMNHRDNNGDLVWNQEDSAYLLLLNLAYPGEENDNTNTVKDLIGKLHQSFIEDRNGITAPLQLVLFVNEDMQISDDLEEIEDMVRIKSISEQESKEIGLSLGIISKESDPRNFMLLVDKIGRVRQVYLSFQENECSNLYRHMSILVPPAARKDIIFKRNQEL